MKIYLHNETISPFGVLDESVLSLAYKTCMKTLQGFDRERIEFLILSVFGAEKYTGETNIVAKLADRLGLKNVFAIRSETASSSGASALLLGKILIESKRFKTGMIVGCEVMSKLNRNENNLFLGTVLSPSQSAFRMSMAQGGAMITQRYLYEYGYQKEDLYFIAKKLHDNGIKNPNAHIKKNLTQEIYKSQPVIASPLGLFDISPLSDGSASLLLSSDLTSQYFISGSGWGTGDFTSNQLAPSFPASLSAFEKAFNEANIKRSEVGVAELHDAFTPFELIGAEDAGLFPRGKALANLIQGVTHPDGDLPINPSGGLKSRGHPLGASGLAQVVELISFMKRRDKIHTGLTHSIGGLATNNFAFLIRRN